VYVVPGVKSRRLAPLTRDTRKGIYLFSFLLFYLS